MEETAYYCDNCGDAAWISDSVYPDIPNLLERMEPGGIVPAGECQRCGSFVYPVKGQG